MNTATNQVQASIDVWRGANPGNLSFRTLLVNPAGTRLYAVLISAGSSHPLSPGFTSVRVFDTLTLSQVAEFTLSGVTRSCRWSPDGARLFCARAELASDVIVIDTATHSPTATIAASFPTSVVMSSDASRLYIAHNDSRVTVHDGGTYALLATVTLPATALALEVTPDGAHLYAAFNQSVVAGWAIELGAATGTGVDTVHVWAYPTSGAAVFVGAAAYGAARPDVGAIFGGRYTQSGFDVTGPLPPGAYDIVAFAHSTTTNSFNGVRLIRVTVLQPWDYAEVAECGYLSR